MTNLFEHTSTHWARYTDYQWRKASDGQSYLLPASEAEARVYDPIPLADQLVTDAVNIGLLVFHKQPDNEIQTARLCLHESYDKIEASRKRRWQNGEYTTPT